MQLNVVSSMTDAGEPVNALMVVFTVQDINDLVEQFIAGADIIDMPSVDLAALLEGTQTDGVFNHIRFVAARDLETFHTAMQEVLEDDDYEFEDHGSAPDDGIQAGWTSPLAEGNVAELDLLDSPEGFNFFKNGGLK